MYITGPEGHFKIYFTGCARPLTFPSKIQNQDRNRCVVTFGCPLFSITFFVQYVKLNQRTIVLNIY
jgi:hypothetical protein